MSKLKKIQETRVLSPYGLSYVSLALLLLNVIEFSYVRGILIGTLCTEIINACDFEDLPAKVKEALNHWKKFESRARELYIDTMRLKLRHFVLVCETALVIQHLCFG